MPRAIWRRLLRHLIRLPFSLAALKAGNSMAARIAMMAMTTSSSMSVKPPCLERPLARGLAVLAEWLSDLSATVGAITEQFIDLESSPMRWGVRLDNKSCYSFCNAEVGGTSESNRRFFTKLEHALLLQAS